MQLLFIFHLLALSLQFDFKEIDVFPDQLEIRTTTSYNFQLQRSIDNSASPTNWNQQLVPTSANISITFPSQFSNIVDVTCQSITIDNSAISSFNCLKQGNKVIIRNAVKTDSYISKVQVVIGNVLNPSPAVKTSEFSGQIGSDVAVSNGNSNVQLQTSQFILCSASFNNAFVNKTYQTLSMSVLSPEIMSSNAYIVVTFPIYWSRDLAQQTLPILTTMICSSNITSNTFCSRSYNQLGQPQVTITGVYSGSTVGVDLTIQNLLTPPTTQPADQITIQSFSVNGDGYDTCDVYVTGMVQNDISLLSVTGISGLEVDTEVGLKIQLTVVDTVSSFDTFFIDFTSSYSPTFNFNNITGSSLFSMISSSDSSINFTHNKNYSSGQTVTINLYSFFTPPSVAETDPFTITIEEYGYAKMKGTFTIIASPAQISNITFAPTNAAIQASSVYSLQFYSDNGIRSSGAMKIRLPTEIAINPTVTVRIEGITVTSEVLAVEHGLKLTNMPARTGPISLTISNLTNPSSTEPLQTNLSLTVFYNATKMDEVAFGQEIPQIAYNPLPTLRASVSSSSQIVLDNPVSLTFEITSKVDLPSNSTIRIQFTNMIVQQSQIENACWINETLLQLCTYIQNNTIEVILINEVDSGDFTLQVRDIWQNPSNTKPKATFVLSTLTSSGRVLQQMNSFIYLVISQPTTFNQFYLASRTNTTNSAISQYQFYIQQPSSLDGSVNQLVLGFPQQIDMSSASCSGCSINNNQLTITISTPSITITIDDVKNPISTEPVLNISAKTVLQFTYLYSQTSTLDFSFQNTQASALVATDTFENHIYGQVNKLTVNVDTVDAQASYLVLTIPADFQFVNLQCGVINKSLCTFVNHTIYVDTQQFQSSSLQFQILNFINPIVDVQSPNTIITYTSNDYMISKAILSTWQAYCSLPCRTCTSVVTQCLTCFDDSNITSQKLYDSNAKNCRDSCLQHQLQQNQQCVQCDSTCFDCSIIPLNCTRCYDDAYLYENQCLTTCPSGYYPYNSTSSCEVCVSPCSTCTTAFDCLTCLNGFYFYNDQCVSNCPSSVTVEDSINNVCVQCSVQCSTCEGQTQNCTTCSSDTAMENGVCVYECSGGKYVYNGQCVDDCVSPCQTCSIKGENCTSCIGGYYFLDYTCYVNCPQYYYEEGQFCLACENLTLNCKDCSNNLTCLNCDTGFVYLNGTCLDYIPDGYANVTGIAQPCTNDCKTCLGLPSNCTSCLSLFYHNQLCIASCPNSHYESNNQCIRCEDPCDTCLNISACLTCLEGTFYVNSTLSCETSCPTYFYEDSLLDSCESCVIPCEDCSDQKTCISCAAGYFLYGTACQSSCPANFIANETLRQCLPCESPCQDCENQTTTCISCISGYHYFDDNNTCLTQCPQNFIVDYESQMCTNCTPPCLICTQHSCSLCSNPYSVYQGACFQNCPSTHFSDGIDCISCSSECSTCVNQSFCSSCVFGYYWLYGEDGGICIDECPEQRPILNGLTCQPCADPNCDLCYPTNECYNCSNVTILFGGICLDECPSGYFFNETTQQCEVQIPVIPPKNETNDTNITNVTEQRVVLTLPVPFLFSICGGGLTLLFGFFKLFCADCFVWGTFGFCWGIPQAGVFAISLYAYYLYYESFFFNVFGYLFVVCSGWLFLLGLMVFFFTGCLLVRKDFKYAHWRRNAYCSYLFFLFCQFFTLINFRTSQLLWSNVNGGPRLQNVEKLKFLSICCALGIVSTAAYTASAIFLISEAPKLLFIWVDGIVVTFVSTLTGLFAIRRSSDFFEERLHGLPLHKREISSQEFMKAGLKGNSRQQYYEPFSESRQVSRESSYLPTSEQSSFFSKMTQRVSQAQSDVTSENPNLMLSEQIFSKRNDSFIESSETMREPSRENFSIQCSMLSSGRSKSKSGYQVYCEFSREGIMGSASQSQGQKKQEEKWNNQYNQNDAVLLDEYGNLIELQDNDSNQADLEVTLKSLISGMPIVEFDVNEFEQKEKEKINLKKKSKNKQGKQKKLLEKQETQQKEQKEQYLSEKEQSEKQENHFEQKRDESQLKIQETEKIEEKEQNQEKKKDYRSILEQRFSKIQKSQQVKEKSDIFVEEDEKDKKQQSIFSKQESNEQKKEHIELQSEKQKFQQSKQLQSKIENSRKDEKDENLQSEEDRFNNSVLQNFQGSVDSFSQQLKLSSNKNNMGSFERDNEEKQSLENKQEKNQREEIEFSKREIQKQNEQKNEDEKSQRKSVEKIQKEEQKQSQIQQKGEEKSQNSIQFKNQQNLSIEKSQQQSKKSYVEEIQQEQMFLQQQKDQVQLEEENKEQLFSLSHSQIKKKSLSSIKESSEFRTSKQPSIQKKEEPEKKYEQYVFNYEESEEGQEEEEEFYEKGQKIEGNDGQMDDEGQRMKALYLQTIRKEEGNDFRIKRKKRNKNKGQKLKVIVVDNKRFKSLKKKTSQLNKQIRKGEKLQTEIGEIGHRGKNEKNQRKTSREKQIKSVYLTPRK